MLGLPFARLSGVFVLALLLLAGCTRSGGPVDALDVQPEESFSQVDPADLVRAAAAKKGRSPLQLGKSGGHHAYAFDDLAPECVWNRQFPEKYHDLTFSGSRYLASCAMGDDLGLVPVNSQEQNNETQTRIKLPRPAREVSISYFGLRFHHRTRTFVAYDEVGNEIDRAASPSDGSWGWLTVTGSIHEVGIIDHQSQTVWDDLTVTLASTNTPPTASAGADQTVIVSESVLLDGSSSSDDDEDPLTYSWTWMSKPVDSIADLASASSETASFVADRSGVYRVQLVVNDGSTDSGPDQVEVRALSISEALAHLRGEIDRLEREGALNRGNANSLRRKIESAMTSIDRRPMTAINKLRAFSNHVGGLMREGGLSEHQAESLVEYAARVSTALAAKPALG